MNRYRFLPTHSQAQSSGSMWYFAQAIHDLPGQHTWTVTLNHGGVREIEVSLDDKAKAAFFETFPNDLEPKVSCPHCKGLIS